MDKAKRQHNRKPRGLSVVNEKVIWASGAGGTIILTIDGGKTWSVIAVPGAEKVDFRDVEAFDANTAYILSVGNGESSRTIRLPTAARPGNCSFKTRTRRRFSTLLLVGILIVALR